MTVAVSDLSKSVRSRLQRVERSAEQIKAVVSHYQAKRQEVEKDTRYAESYRSELLRKLEGDFGADIASAIEDVGTAVEAGISSMRAVQRASIDPASAAIRTYYATAYRPLFDGASPAEALTRFQRIVETGTPEEIGEARRLAGVVIDRGADSDASRRFREIARQSMTTVERDAEAAASIASAFNVFGDWFAGHASALRLMKGSESGMTSPVFPLALAMNELRANVNQAIGANSNE